MIFRLDGSETINEMRSNIGVLKLKSRAKWDGNKLVLEFDGGVEGTGAQTLSLSEDGKELTIEIGGSKANRGSGTASWFLQSAEILP